MNEVPAPRLRISDGDRESALQALGEHMSAGRIDLDEYGERSAKVTAVKTWGELSDLFEDLPQPHPKPATPEVKQKAAPAEQSWAGRPLNQRLVAAMVPLFWIAGIVLFFTIGGWWWFLLPVGVTGMGRSLWGVDWERERRRHHDRHRDFRDRHRHLGH